MGLSLLATTDTQIIRVVEALYNQRPGSTLLGNFQTFVTENSIDAFANSLAADFSSSTDAELAAVITGNLGLTGEALAAGNAYLAAQFASNPAARGKVVLDAMNLLATMESDPVFGAVAATFNADTIASLTYSSTATNTAVTASDAAADVVAGSSYVLTTGVDSGASFTGGAGNDSFVAGDIATNASWTTGDAIDGGDGDDTFTISQSAAITGVPTAGTVSNIEIMSATSGGAITLDTSTGFSGLTSLNTTNSGAAQTITVAATQDVTVTAGAQAATNVSVNGGKDVSYSGTGVTTGTTTIGATTAAAGTVSVSSTNSTGGATTGAIAVTGGTEVSITQVAGNAVNTTTTAAGVTVTGDANTTTVTVNDAAAATAAATVVGHVNGAVAVNDVNLASATDAGTIATVTLGSFAAATIDSSAIATVNLSGTGTSLGIGRGALTATPTENTLALNVNGLTTTGAITDSEAAADDGFTTLNIDSSTAASTIASLVAADATTVNVTGDANLTLTAHTLGAVTDINVNGTGGVSMSGTVLAAATDFDGNAGADAVQLGATTQGITMGAGDDTVIYTAAAGTGGSVDAGADEDTISMTFALANAADANATFNTNFTNFEILSLSDAGTGALDMAGLNGVSKVTTAGNNNGLIANNIASGGTLTLTAAATAQTVNVTNATFNAADTFNVVLTNSTAGTVAYGTSTMAGVETVNITTNDTGTAANTVATVDTATLTAADATSIVVAGNNGLNLTATSSAAVTSFDASGIAADAAEDTAALLGVTYASVNTTATANVSITGGLGNDSLTGNAGIDVITGGAGNDTLAGGANGDTINGGAGDDGITFINETTVGDTMTGGAGNDTFTNANTTAATVTTHIITDFDMGTASASADILQLSDAALTGLTTTTDVVDTGAVSVGAADGTVVTMTSDGQTVASADLVVLANNYADTTAVVAGLATTGADTITYGATLTDNDSFLIAYSDGTDGYVAVATAGAASLTTSEGVDSVANIVKLSGVTSFANFDSSDFAYVA